MSLRLAVDNPVRPADARRRHLAKAITLLVMTDASIERELEGAAPVDTMPLINLRLSIAAAIDDLRKIGVTS